MHIDFDGLETPVFVKVYNKFKDFSSHVLKEEEEGIHLITHIDLKTHIITYKLVEQGSIIVEQSVDLSSLMDKRAIVAAASKLNLELMTWRIVPDLNLQKFAELKVAIVGSGTLGCMVSRLLLQWGVTNFTFVDNGKVAPSNPVRQCLFNIEDVGKNKAQAAAEALASIHPNAECKHASLTIPMPDHPPLHSLDEDVATLDEIISSSDVVFLLTDSREGRWLPSVMGAAHNKLVITAALGFDTWVVVHHNEGCYFCYDPDAPGNSFLDRTLDQACTVTRSGCSVAASSVAVELMANILQGYVLGDIPHMIRGSFRSFEQTSMIVSKNEHCSSCSENIAAVYLTHGAKFVRAACNDRKVINEITGIDEIIKSALTMEVVEFD